MTVMIRYTFKNNDWYYKKLVVWDIFVKLLKSRHWITAVMKSWIKMFVPNNYLIVQDEDCHWYWIPKDLMDKFDFYVEDRENDSWIDWEIYRTWWWPNMVPEYYTTNTFIS